jgi:two-component system, sensor histidine kinase YesM
MKILYKLRQLQSKLLKSAAVILFKDLSILKKLTIAYTLVIAFPAIMAGIYINNQFQQNIQYEIVRSTRQNLMQIKDDINNKIFIAERITSSVGYNSIVMDFLSKNYVLNAETLQTYLFYLRPLLTNTQYINEEDIYKVTIFTNNESIPEYWHILYHDSRISQSEWYRQFINEAGNSRWILPNEGAFPRSMSGGDPQSDFTLVKKVRNENGKYLGVIALNILQEDFFSAAKTEAESSDQAFFVTDMAHQIAYSTNLQHTPQANLLKQYVTDSSNYFIVNNRLYTHEVVDKMNIRVYSSISIENLVRESQKTVKYVAIIGIFSMIGLIGLTYVVFKIFLSKLKHMVYTMNYVAAGDFNIRIPVESRDEIGQIASDFNVLIIKINELIHDVLRKETAQKDAQLMALQYQINPHFIYNTIDIFRMKMELDQNYETADAITDFGEMLRYNMSHQYKFSMLMEEVEHVENYINLQKFRYGERIKFQLHLPPELKHFKVIKFILQPIVENCFKHGLDKNSKMEISICFLVEEKKLTINIRDNGNGVDRRRLDEINYNLRYSRTYDKTNAQDGSIGLANINERLKLYYGYEYYIQMDSVSGEYTNTIITIPYVKKEEEHHVQDIDSR